MKKQPNKWLFFSGLAFQIALIMYVTTSLGRYIDQRSNHSSQIVTLFFAAFGLLAVIWLVYRQSKKFW
jgi:bacteriorhodopsin